MTLLQEKHRRGISRILPVVLALGSLAYSVYSKGSPVQPSSDATVFASAQMEIGKQVLPYVVIPSNSHALDAQQDRLAVASFRASLYDFLQPKYVPSYEFALKHAVLIPNRPLTPTQTGDVVYLPLQLASQNCMLAETNGYTGKRAITLVHAPLSQALTEQTAKQNLLDTMKQFLSLVPAGDDLKGSYSSLGWSFTIPKSKQRGARFDTMFADVTPHYITVVFDQYGPGAPPIARMEELTEWFSETKKEPPGSEKELAAIDHYIPTRPDDEDDVKPATAEDDNPSSPENRKAEAAEFKKADSLGKDYGAWLQRLLTPAYQPDSAAQYDYLPDNPNYLNLMRITYRPSPVLEDNEDNSASTIVVIQSNDISNIVLLRPKASKKLLSLAEIEHLARNIFRHSTDLQLTVTKTTDTHAVEGAINMPKLAPEGWLHSLKWWQAPDKVIFALLEVPKKPTGQASKIADEVDDLSFETNEPAP